MSNNCELYVTLMFLLVSMETWYGAMCPRFHVWKHDVKQSRSQSETSSLVSQPNHPINFVTVASSLLTKSTKKRKALGQAKFGASCSFD